VKSLARRSGKTQELTINIMNLAQKHAIGQAHQHLAQLLENYNNFELTTHDWESLQKVLKNMEIWFDFLAPTDVVLTRKD
jgi:hypothetical protein